MIRKLACIVLFGASIIVVGCNSKADKAKENVDSNNLANEVSQPEKTLPSATPEIRGAAIGYCDCFNQNFKRVDPKIQNIFIRAAESSEPLIVLQQQILSIKDPAEQQRLGEEMQKISGSGEMEACTKKLQEKYKINENDKATQQQVLNALEGNKDCKLVAALMRIGLKQAEMSPNNSPR